MGIGASLVIRLILQDFRAFVEKKRRRRKWDIDECSQVKLSAKWAPIRRMSQSQLLAEPIGFISEPKDGEMMVRV